MHSLSMHPLQMIDWIEKLGNCEDLNERQDVAGSSKATKLNFFVLVKGSMKA